MEITRNIIHASMNCIESYLETEEEFDGWLPTLDTDLTVDNNNMVLYKFYEKPMASNQVLHKRTAMAEDAKIRSLTNELIRRLLRTSERVPEATRVKIVDDFSQKLFNSGYALEQVRRIVLAGIKGYEKLLKNSKLPGGRELQRTAAESSKVRSRRKLTGKTEWFRKPRNQETEVPEDEELPSDWNGNQKLPKGWSEVKKKKLDNENEKVKCKTVPEGWEDKLSRTL